jgi:predicted permease
VALRPHLRLIALLGLIVPRRLRADWRQEWETELRYREMRLADWDRLDRRNKLDLLRRSSSAFWDALWLQRRRLEADMIQDLRYGLRILRTSPGFALVAVLTLALGIGANTAIFTVLDKFVLRTLSVERPRELVALVSAATGDPAIFSYPGYVALRDHNEVLAGLVAYFQRAMTFSEAGRGERVIGLIVSGNYFDVLGVRPALGRFFLTEEDRIPGQRAVVVISHGLWRRRFAAAPDVLGRSIMLNAHAFTVVGVAPPGFTGTTPGTVNDVYVPAMMQAEAMPGTRGMLNNSNGGWLRLIGRLWPASCCAGGPSVDVDAAADRSGVKAPPKSSREFPRADGSRGHTDRIRDLTIPLKLLMGVVGFVLLIACANVANLLLARASVRSREIAVRLAVGASRLRVARQLLTEGALLAAVAGATALGVAYWITSLLQSFQQQMTDVPRTFDGRLDGRALAFTLGLSLLTGIACSLAPARQTSGRCPDALKKGAHPGCAAWRGVNLRGLLVIAQVALSLVVLVGAGLFVKSLRALQAIDPGFEPARVVTASIDLSLNGYDEARGRQFMSDLSARVAALPGVEVVSFANLVAFSDLFWISGASIEGYDPHPGERLAFDMNAIGPDTSARSGRGW